MSDIDAEYILWVIAVADNGEKREIHKTKFKVNDLAEKSFSYDVLSLIKSSNLGNKAKLAYGEELPEWQIMIDLECCNCDNDTKEHNNLKTIKEAMMQIYKHVTA